MKLENISKNEIVETQTPELQEEKKESFGEKIKRLAGNLRAKFAEFNKNKQASKVTMESVNLEADFTPEEQEQLSAIESSAQLETEKAEALLQKLELSESNDSEVSTTDESVTEQSIEPQETDKIKERKEKLEEEHSKEMEMLKYLDERHQDLINSRDNYEKIQKDPNTKMTEKKQAMDNAYSLGFEINRYNEKLEESKGKLLAIEAQLRGVKYGM